MSAGGGGPPGEVAELRASLAAKEAELEGRARKCASLQEQMEELESQLGLAEACFQRFR